MLSATVDFPDDVGFGLYTPATLDRMMELIRSLGVRRVYWLYYGEVDPHSELGRPMIEWMKYGRASLERIGEPVRAAVPAAHRHGLELYAVFKPYNTGLAGTYPEGSPQAGATRLRRIGGTIQQAIPFIEEASVLICASAGGTRHSRATWTRSRYQENPAAQERRRRDPVAPRAPGTLGQRWEPPFGASTRHSQSARRSSRPEREVRDYYGDVVTRPGAPVRVLTLEGMELRDRFIAVTTQFKDARGDFRNTAVAMIEALGPNRAPLPIVVATRSAIWIAPRDLEFGLEFDSGYGPFQVGLDIDNAATRGAEWSRAQGGSDCVRPGQERVPPGEHVRNVSGGAPALARLDRPPA